MKKIGIFILILLWLPITNKANIGVLAPANENQEIYSALHLHDFGLSIDAFNYALRGFQRLKSEGKLLNESVLTIIDFSQSCNKKRFYVIDLYKKVLLFNTYVAHGLNTGDEFAEKFSNKPGTFKSSLGFYLTENIAMGSKVGLSLILKGLEKGINDRASERQIIMHGADYATENFIEKHGRLGRSFGCPSLPPDQVQPVSETIKNGSLLFIYSPNADYALKSKVLN